MDKSDFLFLVSQQKELTRKHPQGLRNWKSTMTLMRPSPFGSQSTSEVRRFNRTYLKKNHETMGKKRDRSKGKQQRSQSQSQLTAGRHQREQETSSLETLMNKLNDKDNKDNKDKDQDHEKKTLSESHKQRKPPFSYLHSERDKHHRPFSPIRAYQHHIDQQDTSLGFEEHPFYDPGKLSFVRTLLGKSIFYREGNLFHKKYPSLSKHDLFRRRFSIFSSNFLIFIFFIGRITYHLYYLCTVGKRSAPAFSLSGRPREPASEMDERPEYVLERGPFGTYTKRKVGFLDVHEALKRMVGPLIPQVNTSYNISSKLFLVKCQSVKISLCIIMCKKVNYYYA